MSTRANVIIKDAYGDHLIFYRHSDGYPEGTIPSLMKFLSWVDSGKIRNNLQQSSGWLILLGAIECNKIPKYSATKELYGSNDIDKINNPKDWKVGAYEPTTGIHGDIEYLYIVDLKAMEIQSVVISKDWPTSKVLETWKVTSKVKS